MQPVLEVESSGPYEPVVLWSIPVGLILVVGVVGVAVYFIARRKPRSVPN